MEVEKKHKIFFSPLSKKCFSFRCPEKELGKTLGRYIYCSQKHLPEITLSSPDSQQDEIITNLYVWRHGETSSNIAKILSGGGDTEAILTDKGHQQAFDLAKKILDLKLPLQTIYSSDLSRAMSTAQPILAAFSGTIQDIIPVPQLREILHGKYERIPADERSKQAGLIFKRELDKIEKSVDSIRKRRASDASRYKN